jgi:hypothetical protein
MERSRLIELAPQYYVIAVCNFYSEAANKIASSQTLWGMCGGVEKSAPVFWRAIAMLLEKKMLEQIPDDFGPTLYTKTERLIPEWEASKKQAGTPASKYAMDPNRGVWLVAALEAVNKACVESKLVKEDFVKPEAEWEPIPVDRTDTKIQKITDALDKTIEAVEGDNGYNATMPEEKAFVVDSLKAATAKLKNDPTISFAYLKRNAINTLDVLIRRFGKASVGLVAQAAREAIFEWLKNIGGQILNWL